VRIQARITELTPLVLELQKRKVKTDDNPDGRQPLQPRARCSGRPCLGARTGPVDTNPGAALFNNAYPFRDTRDA
jgi:hypothetical protein